MKLTVLFGSQTGTAEAYAENVIREALLAGCPLNECRLDSMDEYDIVRII